MSASIPVMRPTLGEDEAQAAADAVRSGWVAQGPRVAAFEEAFATRVGAVSGVAVSSCTAGLHLALHVLGLEPGDEVVVPSFSFIATTNAVRYTGATPVFADVDAITGNVTVQTVARVCGPRTRAVMVVHQAGVPADLASVRAFCRDRRLMLVEDAACAVGSSYDGQPVGAGAYLAAWSFHPRKVLTTGEGGMVTTDDPELAARLKRLREHGMNVSAADRHAAGKPIAEQYLEVGFNYRMTDVQAAIGLVQLGKLDAMVARRRELAAEYHRLLAGIPGVRAVADPPYGTTNYQSFWVLLEENYPVGRDQVMRAMNADGISPRRGIMAAHLEPAYEGHQHVGLPVTEWLTRNSLILPLYDTMTGNDQERVVAVLSRLAETAGRPGLADITAAGGSS
jgi:dTDP-4-amino-4,6-dideoxygalactose transaminase